MDPDGDGDDRGGGCGGEEVIRVGWGQNILFKISGEGLSKQ